MKLYNIHVTLKMARKDINELDLAKAYIPDFILVVVLNKVELELSHVPAALFNMCLTESYFRECWKFSFFFSIFKNVCKRFIT